MKPFLYVEHGWLVVLGREDGGSLTSLGASRRRGALTLCVVIIWLRNASKLLPAPSSISIHDFRLRIFPMSSSSGAVTIAFIRFRSIIKRHDSAGLQREHYPVRHDSPALHFKVISILVNLFDRLFTASARSLKPGSQMRRAIPCTYRLVLPLETIPVLFQIEPIGTQNFGYVRFYSLAKEFINSMRILYIIILDSSLTVRCTPRHLPSLWRRRSIYCWVSIRTK